MWQYDIKWKCFALQFVCTAVDSNDGGGGSCHWIATVIVIVVVVDVVVVMRTAYTSDNAKAGHERR